MKFKKVVFKWPWTTKKKVLDLEEKERAGKIRLFSWKIFFLFFILPLIFAQIWNFLHWLVPGIVKVPSTKLFPNFPNPFPLIKDIGDGLGTGGQILGFFAKIIPAALVLGGVGMLAMFGIRAFKGLPLTPRNPISRSVRSGRNTTLQGGNKFVQEIALCEKIGQLKPIQQFQYTFEWAALTERLKATDALMAQSLLNIENIVESYRVNGILPIAAYNQIEEVIALRQQQLHNTANSLEAGITKFVEKWQPTGALCSL